MALNPLAEINSDIFLGLIPSLDFFTKIEQKLSVLTAPIDKFIPAFPAATVRWPIVGLPHGHMHWPNMPPSPPLKIPSIGILARSSFFGAAEKTFINGAIAARCGHRGIAIWCGGIFPYFQIDTGSSSVWIEGSRASRIIYDTTKHCQIRQAQPSDPALGCRRGLILAGSPNVLIGGMPLESYAGKATAALFKGLIKLASLARFVFKVVRLTRFASFLVLRSPGASKLLSKLSLKNMPRNIRIPTKLKTLLKTPSKNAGAALQKAYAKALPKIKMGGEVTYKFILETGKSTKQLGKKAVVLAGERAVRVGLYMKEAYITCKILRGDPVNIVTGAVVSREEDFHLIGRLPLIWKRIYNSQSPYRGLCGVGWQTPADARLELNEDGSVSFFDGGPGASIFDRPCSEQSVLSFVDGSTLKWEAHNLSVRTRHGMTYVFGPRDGSLHRIQSIRDLDGNSIVFHWLFSDLISITDSSGRHIECRSKNGLLKSLLLEKPKGHGKKSTFVELVHYTQDAKSQLNSTSNGNYHISQYSYGSTGLNAFSNEEGFTQHYQYDEQGRCIHSWGDRELYDYRFQYGEHINQSMDLLKTTTITNARGHKSTVIYNKRYQIEQEIDALGGKTNYAYDGQGRCISEEDPEKNIREWLYDEAGNLTEQRLADGASTLAIYDENSRLTHLIDAQNQCWEHTWNQKGHLLESYTPMGQKRSFTYSPQGDLLTAQNPEGQTTSFQWDEKGNLITKVSPNAHVSYREFNHRGQITRHILTNGDKQTWQYDKWGQLEKYQGISGQDFSFQYNKLSQLVNISHSGRPYINYQYLCSGQLSKITHTEGDKVQLSYDPELQLEHLSTGDQGQVKLLRDELNRIIGIHSEGKGNIRLFYNAAGHISRCQLVNGEDFEINTDSLGRIIEVLNGNKSIEHITHNALGQITNIAGESVLKKNTYNADRLLIEQRITKQTPCYEHDKNAQPLTNLPDKQPAVTGPNKLLSSHFKLEELCSLTTLPSLTHPKQPWEAPTLSASMSTPCSVLSETGQALKKNPMTHFMHQNIDAWPATALLNGISPSLALPFASLQSSLRQKHWQRGYF